MAGWHRYRSRRKAVSSKAIQELQGLGTTAGRGIDVEIQQGLNQRDFILVARLLPGDSRERPNNAQRTTMQVCPAQYEPTLALTR